MKATAFPKRTEADVARPVAVLLADTGFEVYREVRSGYGEARADLVGRRGVATHVVECKTRLSLDLIDQAAAWLGMANLVSVAVPEREDRYARHPSIVLRQLGIGLIVVRHCGHEYASARQAEAPRWHRLDANRPPVRDALHEAQREMGEAGTNHGGYYTAFRWTMREVATFVAAHPGCSVREAVEGVSHHYSTDASARQGIVFALGKGLIPGVRVEIKGKCFALFPVPVDLDG